jgi:hypothetical protein
VTGASGNYVTVHTQPRDGEATADFGQLTPPPAADGCQAEDSHGRCERGRARCGARQRWFTRGRRLPRRRRPRQYFLAVETETESRGAGGVVGNYGLVTAVAGQVCLVRFGATPQLETNASLALPTRLRNPRVVRLLAVQPDRNLQRSRPSSTHCRTDAVAIAQRVDATIVLVSASATTAKDLARTLDALGQVSAAVPRAVLNAIRHESRYRYGGYRYQGYHYRGYKDSEYPSLPDDVASLSSSGCQQTCKPAYEHQMGWYREFGSQIETATVINSCNLEATNVGP